MTDIRKTWGYSKTDSKIFDLAEGEELPDGYYDSPAKIPTAKPKKAKKTPTVEATEEE